jgi:hypothetical protein
MSVPTASYDSGLASQNLLQQDKHMMCHLCTVVHTVKGWAVLALSWPCIVAPRSTTIVTLFYLLNIVATL